MKVFLPLISILLLISSCKPDPIEPINQGGKAGVYDDSYSYFEYSKPLEILVKWDSLNLYGYGEDSIDVDLDGKYDLQFSLNRLNKDSIHLLNGQYPHPFPNFCVNSVNNVQLAVYLEVVYIGLGSTTEIRWVDTLSYQETINADVKWLEPKNCKVRLWGENPTSGTYSFGGWYELNTIKYIGLRMNNKYGWIKIDATDPTNPIFISYAIQE